MWILALLACRHDNELTNIEDPAGGECEEFTFYADSDGDGFGDPSMGEAACEAPVGAVDNADDCDDARPEAHPGAPETCNDLDDDCDQSVDEDLALTWYLDTDSDGYGDPAFPIEDCAWPAGTVPDNNDCDDGDAFVHPGADEVCNSIDDDCDELVDAADPDMDPAALGTWYEDSDGDGWGYAPIQACSKPDWAVDNDDDCDDTDPEIYPGATVHLATIEVCIDGSDWFVFQGSKGWWEHRNYEKAGLHSGCASSETVVDGVGWTPSWSGNTSSAYDPLPQSLPAYATTVSLTKTAGRGAVNVTQQPDAGNGYAAMILFDDDAQGGPDAYSVDLSFEACPP